MRNIFPSDVAFEKIVIGQRETLFQLIPQFPGDRGLNAEIPPVLIKRVTRQLCLLIFGLAGDQIGPLAAGGIVHIPVHELADSRHFRPGGQRRIEISGSFINTESVLLAQALGCDHRVETALLHQRAQNIFRFIIAPALQQQIGLPVAPFIFLFGVLPRNAGKGDRRHLAGKIRRAGCTGKGHNAIRIVSQRDNRRRNRLIIGRHLLGQNPYQAGISRLHRQTDPFKIGQRILLT